MKIADLNAVNRKQIQRAGPRYTPGLDPNAPNIQIQTLNLSLAGLAFERELGLHVRELADNLRESAKHLPPSARAAFSARKNTPTRVSELLAGLADEKPATVSAACRALSRATEQVRTKLNDLRRILDQLEQEAEDDAARREVRSQRSDLLRTQAAIGDVAELLESPVFSLLTRNSLLLLGTWGMGKTHFLCDVTRRRMAEGLPTLLCLAQQLPDDVHPLDGICQTTGLAANRESLLRQLDRLGRQAGGRALLIIDGINEGNHDVWRRALPRLSREVSQYDHVGLILSCRQPFDELIVTPRARGAYVIAHHIGFSEIEFDAQVEYFSYYDIPIPHVPLLTVEFSRPLFLKILCETASGLGRNSKSKYIRDLASGQKGMTKILEDFVRRLGAPIESDFGLQAQTCWWIMKGTRNPTTGETTGLAPTMASRGTNYLSRTECIDILRVATSLTARDSERLLRRMAADGLLIDSVRWRERQPFPVIELPYQRFSDHLIARHLLEEHLCTRDEASIRRSFHANRPLGAIFAVRPHAQTFAMPGLASALMTEFPERTKRILDRDQRELAAYLPRARRLVMPLKDAFLDGIYWRSTDSINPQTDHLMMFLLEKAGEYVRFESLEVLLSVATRPGHPWSADRLNAYLKNMAVADRDLFWSEYVRRVAEGSVVFRLLEWIERSETMSTEVAASCITVTSLLLTTTRKPLRDRATRALFFLGLRHPGQLFHATLASLGFNDPYIPERLLAASYGVAMSHWADPRGQHMRVVLPAFARSLVDRMLVPGAPEATTHVLMENHVLGIVELARRIAPGCVPRGKRRYTSRPLSQIQSVFPQPNSIRANVERVKSVFGMDFENYTLGRLVEGRGNYDYEHTEYKGVRRQILWRVENLGYSDERFSAVDQQIAARGSLGRSSEPDKIERYGKKYSWIAFFELYGVRADLGRLEDWREDRPSDVDIDPSFPNPPQDWLPMIPDVFAGAPTEPGDWLACGATPDYRSLLRRKEVAGHEGPWVLLDAHLEERAPQDPRRVFTFAWGRLVADGHVDDALGRFRRVEFPGNSAIPRQGSDVYTFAGEIPWSHRFASYLRTKTGRSRRHIEPAFPAYPQRRPGALLVETPVYDFGWESYHSMTNQAGQVTTLAPAVSDALSLVNHSQDWDLYEANGKRATVTTAHRAPDGAFTDLLYLREDLLDRYLQITEQQLVLFVWGERLLEIDAYRPLRDALASKYQAYVHVHKRAYIWDGMRKQLRRRV